MTITASFDTFSLDVTGEHVEEHIAQALVRDGLITFDTIHSTEELLDFCTRIGTIVKHRDSNEMGFTRITKRSDMQPLAGYQAFTASHLALHTDGSSMPDPATLLVLWCARPAEEGGVSLFVDGKLIYQVLAKRYPQILQVLATPHSAIFAGANAPFSSSVFSTLADGTIQIRFRCDSLGYYAAAVCEVLPTFLDILNQYVISFPLQKDQGYVVHNGRWLHGRTAFRGEREMYRVLVQTNPASYIGAHVPPGFYPDTCL